MSDDHALLTVERLTGLFAIFFVGTASFLVLLFGYGIFVNGLEWVRTGLLLGGIFCYEIVLASLFAYYYSLFKKRFGNELKNNPEKFHKTLVAILSFTAIVFGWLAEPSIFALIRNGALVALTLFGYPIVANIFQKKKVEEIKQKTEQKP